MSMRSGRTEAPPRSRHRRFRRSPSAAIRRPRADLETPLLLPPEMTSRTWATRATQGGLSPGSGWKGPRRSSSASGGASVKARVSAFMQTKGLVAVAQGTGLRLKVEPVVIDALLGSRVTGLGHDREAALRGPVMHMVGLGCQAVKVGGLKVGRCARQLEQPWRLRLRWDRFRLIALGEGMVVFKVLEELPPFCVDAFG
ncbi:hypothetical protein PspLS_02769 [Pyricularia sp. CBS 133598]|nr:hypothetical protein PspLS_02769 [Pyricularia sp. CBS 133598]